MDVNQKRIEGALSFMLTHAELLGVGRGVAFILAKDKEGNFGQVNYKVLNGVLVRYPASDELGSGTNFFGVAMGKLAIMLDTDMDSGFFVNCIRKGEMPYQGGLISIDGKARVYVGYSGGFDEGQNIEIAKAGLEYLFFGEPKG